MISNNATTLSRFFLLWKSTLDDQIFINTQESEYRDRFEAVLGQKEAQNDLFRASIFKNIVKTKNRRHLQHWFYKYHRKVQNSIYEE